MYKRLLNIPKTHSFFLFGARGTGKSFLIDQTFDNDHALFINLLEPSEFDILNRQPEELTRRIERLPKTQKNWVVIDEVQRIPKLLNVVHHHIESRENEKLLFALTGSSARKLKRGSANLLAGRALVYNLFPFTHTELGSDFQLEEALAWGTLPLVVRESDPKIKRKVLQAYTHTYLKEEILAEQLVRSLDPFHLFLAVAAQMNGKIINYSAIARECGASDNAVREYFQILVDTLLGFFLPPFHESVRKRQRQNPKFFLFDTGVARSLTNSLTIPLREKTSVYGDTFETWLICEIYRLISYAENDFTLSYLRTKDDAEIDLIIERPGLPRALVEIKSGGFIDSRDLTTLNHFARDMDNVQAFCLCNEKQPKRVEEVEVLPWKRGLEELGLGTQKLT